MRWVRRDVAMHRVDLVRVTNIAHAARSRRCRHVARVLIPSVPPLVFHVPHVVVFGFDRPKREMLPHSVILVDLIFT